MVPDDAPEGYREFRSLRYRTAQDAKAAALELIREGRFDVIRRKVEEVHGLTIEEAVATVAFGEPRENSRKDRYRAFSWLGGRGRCKAVFFIKEHLDGRPFLVIVTAYILDDNTERFR